MIVKVLNEIEIFKAKNPRNKKPFYKFLKKYADTKTISDDIHSLLEKNDEYFNTAANKEIQNETASEVETSSKTFLDLILKDEVTDIEREAQQKTFNMFFGENGNQPQAGGGAKKNASIIIKRIIAYLEGDETTRKINLAANGNKEKENKLNEKRSIVIETLKKQVSRNYFDYDFDNFFDLFFPKIQGSDFPAPPLDKFIETNGKIKTFMYSYPVDQATLDRKGDKSKQEKNPFGMQMSVFRKDPNNIEFSEILGVEMWLSILNMSGANTNYIHDYYFGAEDKPNPMYVNEISVKERKPNMMLSDV